MAEFRALGGAEAIFERLGKWACGQRQSRVSKHNYLC